MNFEAWFADFLEQLETMSGATLNPEGFREDALVAWKRGETPFQAAHRESITMWVGE